MEDCALDHEKTSENPLLVKLKEIILNTYAEDSNMRAIVFARTRAMTEFLASWMEDTDDLQHIGAQKYTGCKVPIKDGGIFVQFILFKQSSAKQAYVREIMLYFSITFSLQHLFENLKYLHITITCHS